MSVPAIAVLAALTLSSCGLNSSPSQEGETGAAASAAPKQEMNEQLAASLPAEIQESGVIRVATDPNYPPFETVADDGKTIVGLDPDIAHAVADILGVEIEYVETSFDGIIPAIEAGKVDMAMSSIGDTKEREKTVDFATYYWNGTLILVKKGNPKDIVADQACGVSIGVIRGSLQQNTFLPAQGPKCEGAGLEPPTSQAYQNGPQAQLALKSGRIDGVMLDAPPLLDAAAKSPDEFETVGPLVRNPNPGGVAFPKGSELVEPVNGAINQLIEDGTYAEILEKWNLTDIAIEKSEINGAIE
jgi:polar amino acid transport system substrate-binding protein